MNNPAKTQTRPPLDMADDAVTDLLAAAKEARSAMDDFLETCTPHERQDHFGALENAVYRIDEALRRFA